MHRFAEPERRIDVCQNACKSVNLLLFYFHWRQEPEEYCFS